MQIKIIKNNILFILGILLIIMGIVVYTVPFINNQKNIKIEEDNIQEYIEETKNIDVSEIMQETPINETKEEIKINYLMVLEIPKTSLKKGIYNINSYYNKVNYGIQIMKESVMPNIDKSNVILASHRGNSSISYFNKLEKLENGDKVYIYYNGIKYIYEIVKQYDQYKTGKIQVYRDINKSTVTLITCKRTDKDKQIVLIGNMIEKEKY